MTASGLQSCICEPAAVLCENVDDIRPGCSHWKAFRVCVHVFVCACVCVCDDCETEGGVVSEKHLVNHD